MPCQISRLAAFLKIPLKSGEFSLIPRAQRVWKAALLPRRNPGATKFTFRGFFADLQFMLGYRPNGMQE
jgi:hypothetical protein